MNTIKLEIVTPEGLIFDQEIKSVTLPGSEGEFGVLPGHASLISLLKTGIIDIETIKGNHEVVAINWGHVKIDEGKITVLADGAVAVQGESESEIAASLDNAKRLIESMRDTGATIATTVARIESIARSR